MKSLLPFLRVSMLSLMGVPALVTAVDVSPSEVTRTNRWSLNDLIRELPPVSPSRDRELRKLSALQEGLYLHERRMRGEGLPAPLDSAFALSYDAIVEAMVEDRLPLSIGREYLSLHRQLLARTRHWAGLRMRNEAFKGEVLANLSFFLAEMRERSTPADEVPHEIRTPLLNGYQVWVGELVAWGEESGALSPGARGRIEAAARHLERFEIQYKADGRLTLRQRELLHGRLVDLSRDTMRLATR